MRAVDVEQGQIVRNAAGSARSEAGWLAFHVGLTALLLWIAAVGLAGIPSAVLWFAAGAVATDTHTAARAAVSALLDWRRCARSCRHSDGAA